MCGSRAHPTACLRRQRRSKISRAVKPAGADYSSIDLRNLNYWLELVFSAGIATLGLVLDSPAVVIGAMLISPLMNPIIGAGLALAAADLYLGVKSLLSLLVSTAGAVAFSATLVWLLPFHAPTAEIIARTKPNLLDIGVALFSGLAGSLVVARGGGGVGVTALPGVAIAVALMPPLCTVGFGAGSGWDWAVITGAGLLFLTNLAAIVASAFTVFSIVRLDSADVRARIGALERSTQDKLGRLLETTRLSRSLGDMGSLHWRVMMLVVVLGALFVPLRKGLLQVRDETIARTAVQDELRKLAPSGAFLSRQVDLSPERILVQLVATSAVEPSKIREAERSLIRRTGKEVTISVRKVAGEEELALLKERLMAPATLPSPSPRDIESIRVDLVQRLDGLMKLIWPAAAAPLLDYEVGFTPAGSLVRIRYQSAKPLDPAAEEAIGNLLRTALEAPALRLVLENEPPPRVPKPGARSNRRAPSAK
jgi:uncharacterized hydrophobic protein (TIGR00271 family)